MRSHKLQIMKMVLSGMAIIGAAILFCYFMACYFSKNIEKLEINNLKVLTEKVDRLLFEENIYLQPDTAYFYKLQTCLEGGRSSDTSVTVMENQKKALQIDSNIHTVYVSLKDQAAEYVLVNGILKHRDNLNDKGWLVSMQDMVTECYLEWREINTSFLNQVDLLTLYRMYDSVSYKDDSIVSGYIVVNYYRKHLMNEISAMSSGEENIYLYNAATEELLPMKNSDCSDEWVINLVNACMETETCSSGTQSSEAGNMIYYFDKSGYADLYYLSLKGDVQVSEFMSEVFLVFMIITLLISAAVIAVLIAYYRQRSKYLNGLVQIITATESELSMEEHMMQMLSEDFKEREMDVAIIANKILEDNVDIHELRNAVISEQQLRTEVEMLYGYSQINSHFLLNTLDSIYWKSVANNGIENEETMMVERLCTILKYALDSSDPFISLEEEIACANDYIEIQRIRKKALLKVEWCIPDALKNAKVGKLMLQPVLENCIQHGAVNPEAVLVLRITAMLKGGTLCITVSDDGNGMPEYEIKRMNEIFCEDHPVRSKHIGLLNVNRRLQLQYGKEYGIELEKNQNGKGLTVKLKLKYLTMQEYEGG